MHSLAPGLPFYKGPPQSDTRQTSSFQPVSKRGHVTASVSQPRLGGGSPSINPNSRPAHTGPASATPLVGRSTPQPAWSPSPGSPPAAPARPGALTCTKAASAKKAPISQLQARHRPRTLRPAAGAMVGRTGRDGPGQTGPGGAQAHRAVRSTSGPSSRPARSLARSLAPGAWIDLVALASGSRSRPASTPRLPILGALARPPARSLTRAPARHRRPTRDPLQIPGPAGVSAEPAPPPPPPAPRPACSKEKTLLPLPP